MTNSIPKTDEKVYRFKVALKYRRGLWRTIEVKGSQRLVDLDREIRDAFSHDTSDHLSEFFPGRAKDSMGFGEINPDGGGDGARLRIESLGLKEGDRMEYVYDFGDYVQHVLSLESVTPTSAEQEYPRVVAQDRPRHRYCIECEKAGKKTVATWVCVDCSDRRDKWVPVHLCEGAQIVTKTITSMKLCIDTNSLDEMVTMFVHRGGFHQHIRKDGGALR